MSYKTEMPEQHLTNEQLFDLLDNNCTVEESALYKSHLANCTTCQRLYSEYQLIDSQLSTTMMVSAPNSFTEVVINKWQTTAQTRNEWTYQRTSGLRWAIGFLLLLVVILTGYYSLSTSIVTYGLLNKMPAFDVSYDLRAFTNIFQQSLVWDSLLIVNGILVLLLIDKVVFKPFFQRKRQSFPN